MVDNHVHLEIFYFQKYFPITTIIGSEGAWPIFRLNLAITSLLAGKRYGKWAKVDHFIPATADIAKAVNRLIKI